LFKWSDILQHPHAILFSDLLTGEWNQRMTLAMKIWF